MTEKNNSDIKQKLIENVELKQIMLSYLEFPAYYVLISAIIQSKANSITEIDAFSKKFFIVKNWKVTGFPVLFRENILNGEKESFVLNENYKETLEKWESENRKIINSISQQFKKIELTQETHEKEKIEYIISTLSNKIRL
jgi:hypothetical protein